MIATTIDQSKRLLEVISSESADMYYLGSGATISPNNDEYKLYTEPYYPLYERITEAIKRERQDHEQYGFDIGAEIKAKEDFLSRLIPAWSMSKLWDMVSEKEKVYELNTDIKDPIETLVNILCNENTRN